MLWALTTWRGMSITGITHNSLFSDQHLNRRIGLFLRTQDKRTKHLREKLVEMRSKNPFLIPRRFILNFVHHNYIQCSCIPVVFLFS